jgi:hypothetical protein
MIDVLFNMLVALGFDYKVIALTGYGPPVGGHKRGQSRRGEP